MATIITDLKESFRRGNIYIQLIYINVGVFIFTTLTGVILQLFNRSLGARFTAPLHHPALVCPDVYVYARRSPAYSFQYALAVLVRCLIPELFLCQTLTGSIHLRRNLRRTALYDGLQHLPLFPSDDGVLFHAGSIGIRTRYRGGYRLSGT